MFDHPEAYNAAETVTLTREQWLAATTYARRFTWGIHAEEALQFIKLARLAAADPQCVPKACVAGFAFIDLAAVAWEGAPKTLAEHMLSGGLQ